MLLVPLLAPKKPVETVASFLYLFSSWLALPLYISSGLKMITNSKSHCFTLNRKGMTDIYVYVYVSICICIPISIYLFIYVYIFISIWAPPKILIQHAWNGDWESVFFKKIPSLSSYKGQTDSLALVLNHTQVTTGEILIWPWSTSPATPCNSTASAPRLGKISQSLPCWLPLNVTETGLLTSFRDCFLSAVSP